jgi:malic enzyme
VCDTAGRNLCTADVYSHYHASTTAHKQSHLPSSCNHCTRAQLLVPSQANNAYIFPALGLAAVLTRSGRLADEAFLVAAQALAELADPERVCWGRGLGLWTCR